MADLSGTFPLISQKRSFGSVFFWGRLSLGLGLAVLALAWLIPNHYRPWPSFHSEMLAFVAFTLLLLGRLVVSEVAIVVLPRVALCAVLLVLLPWLQWIGGISAFAGDAWTVSFYLIGFAGAIAVGFAHQQGRRALEASLPGVMLTVLAGALISACIGVLQYLGLEGWFDIFVTESGIGERVLGNLGQTNHLSTLLLLGLVALVYLYEMRRVGGAVLLLAACFLSAVLVMTVSRSGFFSVLALSCFWMLKRRDMQSRLSKSWVGAWMGFFLLATWLLPYLSQALLIGERGLALSGTSGRTLMWKQIVFGILEQPWWGYGWNLTVRAQMAGALTYPGDLSSDYAHNLLLDLLAWNGVPIGAALIAALAYWALTRVRAVRGTDAVYALAFLVPLGVHSLVEYPFAYAYFLLPMGYMVGVIESSLPRAPTKAFRQRYVSALLCIWIVVGGYFVYEYFLIEEDFRVTRFENMRIGRSPSGYEVPTVWLSSHMGAMLEATRLQPRPGMDSKSLAHLALVSSRFGYGALNYRNAQALGLNGDPEGAARQMAMIRGMYGMRYYSLVREEMRQHANGQFPQLKAISLP